TRGGKGSVARPGVRSRATKTRVSKPSLQYETPDRRSPLFPRPPMERYRIADDVGVYFVTVSVVNWLP
ncbi:MAG: hypothetical protein ACHRXM_31960, partial [Isosphaerales bacterium]